MTQLAWALVVLAAGAGCGGRSTGDSAEQATGGAAGRGGSGPHAGRQGVGGAAGGSSSSAGGASQGSGGITLTGGTSGSAGSTVPLPTCLLPLETGPCRASLAAFGYDPRSGGCIGFTYGGCGGNANRFESEAVCEMACAALYPEGCAVDSQRPVGCPCTSADQCNCSSAEFELEGSCAASAVGLCDRSVSEGNCICTLDGELICGV